jgi:hypothetical protein
MSINSSCDRGEPLLGAHEHKATAQFPVLGSYEDDGLSYASESRKSVLTHAYSSSGYGKQGDQGLQVELDHPIPVETTASGRRVLPECKEDRGGFGNTHIRWTLLFGLLIVAIATLPIWLRYIDAHACAYAIAIGLGFFALSWLAVGLCAIRNFGKLLLQPVTPLAGLRTARRRRFKHIVVVPCYIDPLEILFDCMSSLLLQSDPESLVVVCTFEATTPDVLSKQLAVRRAFRGKFGKLLVVTHTVRKGIEIPGGCSNKNFALRSANDYLRGTDDYTDPECAITCTTCDTDSLFHPTYFDVLEASYNKDNPHFDREPRAVAYQPSMHYNWDLDKRPFFVRVTSVMRSMMMLGGLISFDINPMSIFSYPLEMGLRAGFINPRLGVDDIAAKVNWMVNAKRSVPVALLPIQVISGPTVGVTWCDEVDEWGRQIRRWIAGSSESFHYFIIHWKGTPFFSGLQWFLVFFLYYGVMLCCAGIFSLFATIPNGVRFAPDYSEEDLKLVQYSGLGCLVVQYCVFFIAFVIDYYAAHMLTVREDIFFLRNVLHWVVAPLVLMCYSAIAFVSIVRFMFVGKGFARHDMSGKDGLASVAHGDLEAKKQALPEEEDGISIEIQEGDDSVPDSELLCQLPQTLSFGEYYEELDELKTVHRRTNKKNV